MTSRDQDNVQMLEGFTDPVGGSQQVFRQILQAMSRPGQVVAIDPLPPAPMAVHRASIALCLALLDHDTPLWLDDSFDAKARQHISFHTGAPPAALAGAAFAVVADGNALPDMSQLWRGDAEYPERGATLIIQVAGFDGSRRHVLRGPGVDGSMELSVRGLDDEFWPAFADNQHRFPLGFDTILVHDNALVALPRSIIATHPAEV